MNIRLVLSGFAIWAGGTIVLRLAGQWILRPGHGLGIVILFVASFPFMGWIVRRLCQGVHLPPQRWLSGAVSVAPADFAD